MDIDLAENKQLQPVKRGFMPPALITGRKIPGCEAGTSESSRSKRFFMGEGNWKTRKLEPQPGTRPGGLIGPPGRVTTRAERCLTVCHAP